MDDELDAHYRAVVNAVADGRLTPFLGAGVNLCGRPENQSWSRGRFLPSGAELAGHLVRRSGYEVRDPEDLLLVSQHLAVMDGSGPLYLKLREVFDADYPTTALHRFLATLMPRLRKAGRLVESGQPVYPVIVTTNYDDVLETAFRRMDEPFDLVWYASLGEYRGRFIHQPPDGEARVVECPNTYLDVSLTERPAILKIHGAINRQLPDEDSYVITQDDYIAYLTQADISNVLPAPVAAKLRRSNFLFLGYSLQDWNLRVILHRIWTEQQRRGTFASWAIQRRPDDFDRKFWATRDVEILDVDLADYVRDLRRRLKALTPLPTE
jgi:hypothetical protein